MQAAYVITNFLEATLTSEKTGEIIFNLFYLPQFIQNGSISTYN